MAWTAPRTWTTGELVTAAFLNTHLRDNLLDVAFNGHRVVDRVTDSTGSTISTTEVAEVTATLAIPASWSGYDIEAIVTADLLESGTLTATRSVDFRLRLTDATGTVLSVQTVQIGTAAPNRNEVTVNGFLEGQSATGNVPIVFTTQLAADSAQASYDNATLIAAAYRTS
jgi:hypothetical protein